MSLPPTVWGNHYWKFLHYSSLVYPLYPNENDKSGFKNIINTYANSLPCNVCRVHLRKNLTKHVLTDDVLSVKLKLVLWVHDLHNIVNKITGKRHLDFETAMVRLFTQDHEEVIYKHEHKHDHGNGHDNEHDHEHENDESPKTYESILNYYNKNKKNTNTELTINVSDVFTLYEKENEEYERLKREAEEGRKKFLERFPEITEEELRKREMEGREKYLESLRSFDKSEHNIDVPKQDNINVDKLIKNFFEAINNTDNEDKKHDLLEALKLILSCF